MKKCIIFGSMPITSPEVCKRYLSGDFMIIAADGGDENCKICGLTPDVRIGDSDSSIGDSPDISLPTEKDISDVWASIDFALSKGCGEFVLLGCTGGRLDHFLCNVGLLEYLEQNGTTGILVDEQNEITLHSGPCRLAVSKKPGWPYVSFLALDDNVHGITLKGFKYPLDDYTLYRACPIAISNELEGEAGEISFRKGRILCVRSRDLY